MDYQQIIEELCLEIAPLQKIGKVADYIPELAKVPPEKFGISLITLEGKDFYSGLYQEAFSIQSISKVFGLSMALSLAGDSLWSRVGVEPSGTAFNSIVQLEYEKGIPRNPFINAGALVVADVLLSHLKSPKADLLEFIRTLAKNPAIDINIDVYISERNTGSLNASLAYMLKSYGNIKNDVNQVLDFYFFQCSIMMSCYDLATAMLAYADHSKSFDYAGYSLTHSGVKRLNAVMLTCGFYDESGEFSFRVGLPGKSGVGGGIVAIYPQRFSVAVWSPRLNQKGNSVMGMKALELLTTKTGLSVF
ncbi:MAG: glutaminase [Bacteroidota bacterium]|nr:MAG: glutaminase [Bacteroidota bacterium]